MDRRPPHRRNGSFAALLRRPRGDAPHDAPRDKEERQAIRGAGERVHRNLAWRDGANDPARLGLSRSQSFHAALWPIMNAISRGPHVVSGAAVSSALLINGAGSCPSAQPSGAPGRPHGPEAPTAVGHTVMVIGSGTCGSSPVARRRTVNRKPNHLRPIDHIGVEALVGAGVHLPDEAGRREERPLPRRHHSSGCRRFG